MSGRSAVPLPQHPTPAARTKKANQKDDTGGQGKVQGTNVLVADDIPESVAGNDKKLVFANLKPIGRHVWFRRNIIGLERGGRELLLGFVGGGVYLEERNLGERLFVVWIAEGTGNSQVAKQSPEHHVSSRGPDSLFFVFVGWFVLVRQHYWPSGMGSGQQTVLALWQESKKGAGKKYFKEPSD